MQITPYNYTTPYEPNSGKQSKKREKKKTKKNKAQQKATIPPMSKSPKTSQSGISGLGSTYLTANERDPVG